MKITKVTTYKVDSKKGNLRGFASVELDEELVVKNIKIIEGKKGMFIAMPNEKGKDDNYYDVVFPITSDFREKLTKKILDEFDE